MSVYHCPVCPLIFEHRSEVEWHMREEHRSRVDEETQLRAELVAAQSDLDWERLRSLQAATDRPAVTLLMATTPSTTMTGLDVARLRQLANRARRRLSSEPGGGSSPSLAHRLGRAVAAAEGGSTDRGVAVLVSSHQLAIFRLPFEPRDRAVVDPTFATRDLERMLERHPRYRVLVLSQPPRLLEGRGKSLTELIEPAPPSGQAVAGPAAKPRRHGRRGPRSERWLHRGARLAEGCEAAEGLLERRENLVGELPLIVMGDNRWLAAFRHRNPQRAVGGAQVTGYRRQASVAAIAELAQPVLAAWRAESQARDLELLAEAEGLQRVQRGLEAAWAAVTAGRADRVWVEQSVAVAGRFAPDGTIEPAPDPAAPGVQDDLVDDLIEQAGVRGLEVSIVEDGLIGDGRIAVRMRPGFAQPDRPTLLQVG